MEKLNFQKHEEFLQNLTNTLKEDIEKKEKYSENLKSFIENLIEKNLKEFEIEYEIGSSVYLEAEIKSQNKIILKLGLDIFAELNYEEALNLIKIRTGILKRKIQLLDEQIIKNKAYIKLSRSILDQLKEEKNE